jgi:hypothetical protein
MFVLSGVRWSVVYLMGLFAACAGWVAVAICGVLA